jgi:hypothetical protein
MGEWSVAEAEGRKIQEYIPFGSRLHGIFPEVSGHIFNSV